MAKKSATFRAVVMMGPEGPCLYVNGHRVAGPKPWGGGRVLHSFEGQTAELKTAAKTREAP